MSGLRLALVLAFLSGYVALSYEILWVRIFSFVSRGVSYSFGVVLGAYLLGLALGSLLSIAFQDARDAQSPRQLRAVGVLVLLANAVGFGLVPAVAWSVSSVSWYWGLGLVAGASMLLGATFPLLCHYAVPADDQAGAGMSYLYLVNIVGSAVGSLLTGFVLMDSLTVGELSIVLASLGAATAAGVFHCAQLEGRAYVVAMLSSLLLVALVVASQPSLYGDVYERLQLKEKFEDGLRFAEVVETKSGVITVTQQGEIYGGGAYDGRYETGLKSWSWMVRPYALSALHPAPREVLVIGLSSGSWTRVIADNPEVERVTVVEINDGYVHLLARYPAVAGLLSHPKVSIEIDDGRRWLRRNSERRFDAVVFNGTHHWRSFSTNVLSKEFLELVRSRLAPGGIFYYNTTFSDAAQKTAVTVFPHALMVINCIAVSDSPIIFDKERWRSVLSRYPLADKALFDLQREADRRELEGVLALADRLDQPDADTQLRLESRASIVRRTAGAMVVTDDNMATEWRH